MTDSLIELAENVRAALMTYAPLGQEFGADVAVDYLRDAEELVAKLRQHTAEQPQEVVERFLNDYSIVRKVNGGGWCPLAYDEQKAAIAAMNMGEVGESVIPKCSKESHEPEVLGASSANSSEISVINKIKEYAEPASNYVLDGNCDVVSIEEIAKVLHDYGNTTIHEKELFELIAEAIDIAEDFPVKLTDHVARIAINVMKPYLRTTEPHQAKLLHCLNCDDLIAEIEQLKKPVLSDSLIKRLQSVRLFLRDKQLATECEGTNSDDFAYQIGMIEGVLDAAGVKYGD